MAANKQRKPKVGALVQARIGTGSGEAEWLPFLITHVLDADEETVSGVVFTAYPMRIGHSRPAQVYADLPRGTETRNWRWPPPG